MGSHRMIAVKTNLVVCFGWLVSFFFDAGPSKVALHNAIPDSSRNIISMGPIFSVSSTYFIAVSPLQHRDSLPANQFQNDIFITWRSVECSVREFNAKHMKFR